MRRLSDHRLCVLCVIVEFYVLSSRLMIVLNYILCLCCFNIESPVECTEPNRWFGINRTAPQLWIGQSQLHEVDALWLEAEIFYDWCQPHAFLNLVPDLWGMWLEWKVAKFEWIHLTRNSSFQEILNAILLAIPTHKWSVKANCELLDSFPFVCVLGACIRLWKAKHDCTACCAMDSSASYC